MARILVVDDQHDLRTLLTDHLASLHHDVTAVADGAQAREAMTRVVTTGESGGRGFDLLVLDLMLPRVGGDTLLTELRAHGRDTAVLVISAKDAVRDKVRLLGLGADDYLTKPFDLDELSARIEAILWRTHREAPPAPARLRHGNLVVDPADARVTIAGREVHLTLTELRILELLLSAPTKVFSKAAIHEAVWGGPFTGDDNTLKSHLSKLRSKLRECDPDTDHIETVWGLGYRISRS